MQDGLADLRWPSLKRSVWFAIRKARDDSVQDVAQASLGWVDMVEFMFVLRFVVAAGSIFVILNVTLPLAYDMWYNQLREQTVGDNWQLIGDVFFSNFLILTYVIPGIVIIWGFVVAQRKRVQEFQDRFA